MADAPAAGKKFMGQPAWVWGVAGAVVLVAAVYLYRKKSAASAQAASQPAAGAVRGGSFFSFIQDQQGGPSPQPKPKPKPKPNKQCPPGYRWDPDRDKCVPAVLR